MEKSMSKLILFIFIIFISSFSPCLTVFAQNLNLLENPGFEKKSIEIWTELDSCQIKLYDLSMHSGKRSLAFYPLKDGAGISVDISAIIQRGYRYRFCGWFRNLEAGWGQVDVILMYRQKEDAQQINLGRVDCDKDVWNRISGEFMVPEKADSTGLQLAIKTAWGRIAFLVDDLELRPALEIQIIRSSPISIPAIVYRFGPPSQKRSQLQAQVKLFDQRNQSLTQYNQTLYTLRQDSLPAGFYRLVATIIDVDKQEFTHEKICYYGMIKSLTIGLENQVKNIFADQDLNRYQGWIRYLQYLVSICQNQDGAEADQTLQALFRLNRWVQDIRTNPNILDTLSSVQEWAYLSWVDDSGQPFKLAIPSGYDSKKTYPLVVVMHGYGGNHMEYSGGVKSNPDYFELHVLGRARGGGYVDLSEADVLAVVEYVQKNWSIDKRRIHLTGASMGGGGTFRLATRYPDQWASGRPVCGYGSDLPIRNARYVPIYSTHSQDDPTVPVLGSRAPLQKLIRAGGEVIIDETTGLQHAAWNYAEGNNRALQWMYHQVLPEFNDIKYMEYTAVDRQACSAYWLKVAEWGNSPGPAYFQARAGLQNQLYLRLENINRLLIKIVDAPIDKKLDLNVSVNGGVPFKIAAPLADSIFIITENGKWSAGIEKLDPAGIVLHTAGGVHNLYHNEPLLIVYGTGGDPTVQQFLAQAALAASKSPGPMWVGDQGDIKEGVPNHQLLYGHLKIKPDTTVTTADLKKCNLLLIGTAEENQIVQQMSKQLPVQFGKEIICSDGVRLPGTNSMLGLYYYNPLASDKLIYWVAADNPADYKPYNLLMQLQNNNPCGTDLLVVRDSPPMLIKVRSFDSRWNWSNAFNNSARIAADENTFGDVFRRIAESIRKVSGSDFSLQQIQASPEFQAGMPGLTQWSDFAALYPTTPIAVVQINGTRLLGYQQAISERGLNLRFYPLVDQAIKPERNYQVSLPSSYYEIQQLINLQPFVPDSFEIMNTTVFEAMRQMLF